MNASKARLDVQASHRGLDLIGDAIAAMRTGRPQVARALLHAPWGLRFPAVGAIGVQIILKGSAWLAGPGGGDPIALGAGDIALIRRHATHALADDPATPLWDADYASHMPDEHWPADGSALDPATSGTVLMGGTYDLAGARPHPLFADPPDVVHLPARIGIASEVRAVVDLLGAELDRDLPGASAATPALLDLLLLYALRAWFEAPQAPSGWADASRDPELSVALRLIHDHPQQPWTVAQLANRCNLSRAAFGDREPHTEHPDVGDTLLSTTAHAIRSVATEEIEVLDDLLAPLLAAPYDTAQWLAYQGLGAAGARRSERSADVLLEREARLQSGYPTNPYWTTRELLIAIAEHLDPTRIARLEAAIRALEPEYERARGYVRFTLLSALPEARLSAAGAAQLTALREEFGQDQPDPPPPSVMLSDLEPDLAPARDFSDDEWLAAIRDGIARPAVGAAYDQTWRLAQALGEATKLEPARFAKLSLRINTSFDPTYLPEVLKALAEPAESVPAETIWPLVRHAAALQVAEHSRWISWPLRSLTGEDIPDDILDLLNHVALHAPDPIDHSAEPEGSDTATSQMFTMSGLNSARGQAANTLARLIFADGDGSRTARVAPALSQLAGDSSLGVRAMVADVFTACLIHARAATTAAVPTLVNTHDRLLVALSVQNLLYYLAKSDKLTTQDDIVLCTSRR